MSMMIDTFVKRFWQNNPCFPWPRANVPSRPVFPRIMLRISFLRIGFACFCHQKSLLKPHLLCKKNSTQTCVRNFEDVFLLLILGRSCFTPCALEWSHFYKIKPPESSYGMEPCKINSEFCCQCWNRYVCTHTKQLHNPFPLNINPHPKK
jgi:hypothetical protein